VKLRFPTLDDDYESDWCRVTAPGVGPARGVLMLPEINDEVLVGFESGDMRRPFVLGGLWNGVDAPPLADDVIEGGEVRIRAITSRLRHRLIFSDDDSEAVVGLLSGDSALRIMLNQSDTTIEIASDGSISISGGDVTIESSGDMSITASGSLSLEGTNVSIESSANLDLSAGAMLDVSAGGNVRVLGAMIQLN
jgi:uncharacterized protein involved in type VI secretion and phage assembly